MTVALAVTATVCTSESLLAQNEVYFKGRTEGCFSANSTGACTLGSAYGGLEFNAGSFAGWSTPARGFLGIGSKDVSFGSFTLSKDPFDYENPVRYFFLHVLFDDPSGAGDPTRVATLQGEVSIIPGEYDEDGFEIIGGGATVLFPTSRIFVPFDNGSFTLRLNSPSVSPGGTFAVSGDIYATVVPEPGSIALVATGLMGLVPAFRRRTKGQG
jgi:hypothetical protein